MSKRKDKDRLLICLAISAAIHFFAFVALVLLGGAALLANLFLPEPPEIDETPKLVLLQPSQFLETDATQESKEKPEETRFYSDRNTLAADQSKRSDQNRPEIRGRDKLSPATMDVTLAKASPPSPASKPPQPEKEKPAEKAERNKPTEPVKKELALLKPNTIPADAVHPEDLPVEAQKVDPREIDTPDRARAPPSPASRQPQRTIPTEASSLTGGISRKGVISFDTAESPAGHYDKILIQAISQRWYLLIGERYRNKGGVVRIEFELLADGQVTNLRVQSDSGVGPILADFCRQAVIDSAPYRPFPDNLRPFWGDSRPIKITFQYAF